MSFQKTTQQGLTQAPGKDLVSLSDSKNGFCSVLGTSPTNQAWVLLAAVASPPRNPDSIRCVLLIIVCLPVRMQLQKTEATLALFCRLRPKIHILVIEDPARLCPITAFPRASVRPVCLVSQLCPTLCDPMDCSPPGSTVHVILQARILEWVAIVFSRGIFPTQGSNLCLCISCTDRWILYNRATWKAPPGARQEERVGTGPC